MKYETSSPYGPRTNTVHVWVCSDGAFGGLCSGSNGLAVLPYTMGRHIDSVFILFDEGPGAISLLQLWCLVLCGKTRTHRTYWAPRNVEDPRANAEMEKKPQHPYTTYKP